MTRPSARGLFAHDPRDALLVIISLAELGGKLALVACWQQLPLVLTLLFMALLALLNCMNFFCAAHSFLPLPFFSSPWLNRIWGVLGSLSLGVPHSMYRAHHLNHHRFVSDYRDDHIGDTRDRSSIYRHGKGPQQAESLWRYALLGPLRDSPWPIIADVRRAHKSGQLIAEAAALALLMIVMGLIDWRGLLLVYLPIGYVAQVLARIEVYSEHFGAKPGDPRTNAVSCYGGLYNLLWFNNGYHQEHHFRPGTHWTGLPALKDQMLPETDRRVVPGAHCTNVGLDWVRRLAVHRELLVR